MALACFGPACHATDAVVSAEMLSFAQPRAADLPAFRYQQELQQLEQRQKMLREHQRTLKDTSGDCAHQMEMLKGMHKLLQLKLQLYKQGNVPTMPSGMENSNQAGNMGVSPQYQQTVGTADVMTL